MARLRFDIITLFPNFFSSPLQTSLLAKSIDKNLIEVFVHDLRKFGVGKHRSVDDRPFGGGPGMVIRSDVLAKALGSVMKQSKGASAEKPYVVLLDPGGNPLEQKKARSLSKRKRIILICGHYEGVDERFKENYVDEQISIGDYILSGGETASLVILESVGRLLPGFLGKKASTIYESFSPTTLLGKRVTTLDYPVYTKPASHQGREVPKILLSGNHKEIDNWRRQEAIRKTKLLRPDLVK